MLLLCALGGVFFACFCLVCSVVVLCFSCFVVVVFVCFKQSWGTGRRYIQKTAHPIQ